MIEGAKLYDIYKSVVAAMEPILREYDIDEGDLRTAAQYFNGVGKAGVFPALMDIAFSMCIIDRKREAVPGTRLNMEGPEYEPGAPVRWDGNLIERDVPVTVPRLTLNGRVLDALSGEPIPGAEVDIWHADENGGYDRGGVHLRGVLVSDDEGRFTVHTLLPKDYAEHESDPIGDLLRAMDRTTYRAAHIHLKVRVAGQEVLTTQLFRGDSPYLETDYVEGAVSDDLVLRLTQLASDPPHFETSYDLLVCGSR